MRWILLLTICCALLSPVLAHADQPIAVGDRTCLFLDDHFIAEQNGLTRTFHRGKPHPKAIINETEPWEHWICLWGSCFYDPDAKVYRMYYQSTIYPSGEPGISFRDYLMYAESKDGVTWVKPKLGIVEHNGSKDNNIVMAFAGPANVFLDPKATDPKSRIKAQFYLLKKDPKYDNAQDMNLFESADGVNFKRTTHIEKPGFAMPEQGNFVDGMIIGWDSLKQKYLANFRCFSIHPIAEKKNGQRRACGITWSDEIHKGWSPTVLVVPPDEKDDARATKIGKDPAKPDWTELYMMPISVYGNHYLGVVTLFDLIDSKDGNGGGGMEMAFSNDGLKWTRLGQGVNCVESGDDPELFPNFAQFNPFLDMGNETWLFYCETNGTHGVQPFEKSRGRIRAGVWRKDGFVSLDTAAQGTLITKPIVFDGKELLVNFVTQDGGSVRVGLLDENSQAISQFNLGECQAMRGDQVAQKVTWAGGTDIAKFSGKPVRLMFELDKAQLYGFRFTK